MNAANIFFYFKMKMEREERAEDIATVGKCGIRFYREAHSTFSLRKNQVLLNVKIMCM